MRRLKLSLSSNEISAAVLAVALVVQWARAWMLSSELAWGWAVPVMCAYFFWQRRIDLPPPHPGSRPAAQVYGQAGGLLALAAISRLWLEPFPGWPLMEWIYSLSLLGVIWLLQEQSEGRPRANHRFFPLALGLVAIPWPALVTEGLIGHLRIGIAGLAAELLTAAHWPAVATGTTIETARGSVGIDEACGGIHSLQTAVLVALAVGELRRESWGRRVVWLFSGIGVSLFFNTLRIVFLAWQCATGGTAAARAWHDPAATAEMLLILGTLGGLAMLPGARVIRRVPAVKPADRVLFSKPKRRAAASTGPKLGNYRLPAIAAAAVLATEAAIALWFWPRRTNSASAQVWPAHLPAQLLSFEPEPYTDSMDELLHADRHELGRWRTSSGQRREAYVLEWNRGQRAQYVLRGHNPDVCLGLAGSEAVQQGQTTASVDGVPLGFETRVFRRAGANFYVYFLAWNLTDNVPLPWGSSPAPRAAASAWASRWEEIAAHRRGLSARVMTIAIFDAPNAAEADAGFSEALKLITRRSVRRVVPTALNLGPVGAVWPACPADRSPVIFSPFSPWRAASKPRPLT